MKRFIQVGTGGFGEYWCSTVLPRVASFARPVAAVDINAQALQNARRFLNLPEERCYLDLQKALHEVSLTSPLRTVWMSFAKNPSGATWPPASAFTTR